MAKDLRAAGAELPELMDVGRWSTTEHEALKGVSPARPSPPRGSGPELAP